MKTALDDLTALGQSPWVDGISLDDLRSGGLADLAEQGIRGLTTNPTLFREALRADEESRHQLAELLRGTGDPKQAYLRLAEADARHALAILDEMVPDPGPRDGWVSLEVDPRSAYDVRATVEEAYRLHRAVDHRRFFVKIPGTVQGLVAIEEATALGVRVNVTLLFSVYRHRQAAEAYLRGLRRLRASGGDLRGMASVASFFVSRVDTAGDEALRAVGGDPSLTGRLAVANAKVAYWTYKEVFCGTDWDELAAAGAAPQWCLWASTSTKDPAYHDTKYVESLIGPDTITTMPHRTIEAFLDHGRVASTLDEGVDEADLVIDGFREAGVDYDALTGHLEKVGIRDFSASFTEMLADLAAISAGG